jgi:hypothetical protein
MRIPKQIMIKTGAPSECIFLLVVSDTHGFWNLNGRRFVAHLAVATGENIIIWVRLQTDCLGLATSNTVESSEEVSSCMSLRSSSNGQKITAERLMILKSSAVQA